MSKVVVVVPTCRPESHASFVKAWTPLFEKHSVTLVTVWDGDELEVTLSAFNSTGEEGVLLSAEYADSATGDLFCRHTDACRNLGFVEAAQFMTSPDDVLITLDDDVVPLQFIENKPDSRCPNSTTRWGDPIQSHLDALARRVPISWMNTAQDTDLYLRGVPYKVRDEAPVMLSHGVWVGTPDFDGETQLRLEESQTTKVYSERKSITTGSVPYSLPYFVGPVPKGVLFPMCGMNLAVRRDALPYLYFAPMGPDSGVSVKCSHPGCGSPHKGYIEETRDDGAYRHVVCPSCNGSGERTLHRFGDIWMGIWAKREFDRLGWACYTGYSTVLHTRASDAKINFEREKLGREWNERVTDVSLLSKLLLDYRNGSESSQTEAMYRYFSLYAEKRQRYAALISSILKGKGNDQCTS